jgi:hypothetical protein
VVKPIPYLWRALPPLRCHGATECGLLMRCTVSVFRRAKFLSEFCHAILVRKDLASAALIITISIGLAVKYWPGRRAVADKSKGRVTISFRSSFILVALTYD